MAPAPRLVGLALGISVAALILLVGPLLLFNPAFTSLLQQRHGVAASFDTTQADVDRVTSELLADIWTDGDFEAALEGQTSLLDANERSHMHDVAVLVRLLGIIALVAAAIAVVTWFVMRRERYRRGMTLMLAAAGVGAAGVSLGILFAVAFEQAFLTFHVLLFPPGTYLFEPGSNLITLFPQPFWFEAALAAGVTIVISAALVGFVGYRLIRGADRPPDHA